ncbi:MAG: hypothetical protein U0R26_11340 [Solirubrobacterales bacterium]
MAVNKEIDLRFVFGYTPSRFRDTLNLLANGRSTPGRCSPARSGSTTSRRVRHGSGDPEQHAKILIDPQLRANLQGLFLSRGRDSNPRPSGSEREP